MQSALAGGLGGSSEEGWGVLSSLAALSWMDTSLIYKINNVFWLGIYGDLDCCSLLRCVIRLDLLSEVNGFEGNE